jgi:uncharacterized membrane protein YhaH (DUF805 family)
MPWYYSRGRIRKGAFEHSVFRRSAICWCLEPWKKFAVLRGRATRREFWWFVFGAISILVVLTIGDINTWRRAWNLAPPSTIETIKLLFIVVTPLPLPAVMVRRWHDVGKSAWLLLILSVSCLFAFLGLGLLADLYLLHKELGETVLITLLTAYCTLVTLAVAYPLVLLGRDSQPGENRYGPNPKGITDY